MFRRARRDVTPGDTSDHWVLGDVGAFEAGKHSTPKRAPSRSDVGDLASTVAASSAASCAAATAIAATVVI